MSLLQGQISVSSPESGFEKYLPIFPGWLALCHHLKQCSPNRLLSDGSSSVSESNISCRRDKPKTINLIASVSLLLGAVFS